MSLHSLTISLTHASGAIGRVAAHNLSIFVSALKLDGLRTSGSVSLRGQQTRSFSLDAAQFDDLCRAAEELTSRTPDVKEVVDTSESWAWVLLHVAHERGERTLKLSLFSSGFDGPDAATLHRFFDVLLAAAGVRDDGVRRDLVDR